MSSASRMLQNRHTNMGIVVKNIVIIHAKLVDFVQSKEFFWKKVD
jgi:hypothetical protein